MAAAELGAGRRHSPTPSLSKAPLRQCREHGGGDVGHLLLGPAQEQLGGQYG